MKTRRSHENLWFLQNHTKSLGLAWTFCFVLFGTQLSEPYNSGNPHDLIWSLFLFLYVRSFERNNRQIWIRQFYHPYHCNCHKWYDVPDIENGILVQVFFCFVYSTYKQWPWFDLLLFFDSMQAQQESKWNVECHIDCREWYFDHLLKNFITGDVKEEMK